MGILISIAVVWLIGYTIGRIVRFFRADRINMDHLDNDGMIDMMHRHYARYQSVDNLAINKGAQWQRWIRR